MRCADFSLCTPIIAITDCWYYFKEWSRVGAVTELEGLGPVFSFRELMWTNEGVSGGISK